MDQIRMSTGHQVLPPALQDLVDQTVDLMKLELVQGLAAEAAPTLIAAPRMFTARGATRLAPGSALAARLRTLAPSGSKRGARGYADRLPLEDIYTAEIRSLSRSYGVDLADPRSPFDQIDKVQSFRMASADLIDSTRMVRAHANLFDVTDGDEIEATDAGAARASGASRAGVHPAVERILSERVRTLPSGSRSTPGAFAFFGAAAAATAGTSAAPIVLNKGLKLRLHEVRCIDETNPEWLGSDEIGLGGVAVSDTGTATKINEFKVGGGFDDGDRQTYSPARELFTFSLANVTYPADFMVTLALAEKDGGGLSSFIKDLWEAIKDHVDTILMAVGAAAGAAIGAATGGTAGTIAGPLGTIIGIVAGAILGALVGWLISVLKDDIFTPMSAAIRLPEADSTFAGGRLYSPTQSVTFADHGGKYRVYYSWLINR